ncbi:MAG: hypothetical protein FJ011_01880 [Chloroflexi bacterium]|nr:hypothetical protein [Chloroflexota bacterium]
MAPYKSNPAVTGEWECMECGYIEEGAEARRPLKCPECDAPGSALEFFSYEDDDSIAQDTGEDEFFEEDDDAFDDEGLDDLDADYDDDER